MVDLCDKMEKFGKGIGNASRYRIVEALLKGRKTVGELVKIVGISQPAVSQHLKTLKACHMVIDERCGQEVFYTVDTTHLLGLLKALSENVRKEHGRKRSPS